MSTIKGKAPARTRGTRHRADAATGAESGVASADEHLVITASKQITLECGESSITLTAAGKIIIRGKYIVSRSSGVQRIKGGSVQIN
jgi:uncharacterized protein (DUF2345 family)